MVVATLLALMAMVTNKECRVESRATSGAITMCIDWPLNEPLIIVKYLFRVHVNVDITIFIVAIQGKQGKRNSLDKKKYYL